MQTRVVVTAIVALILGSCAPDKKTPGDQSQVTSPRQAEPGIDEQIDVDEQPEPVNRGNPAYPEKALKERLEGTVWVKVLVTKEGAVKKVVVMNTKKGYDELEKAAVDAAMTWTFKPAMKNNQPLETWVAIPFRFKLQK